MGYTETTTCEVEGKTMAQAKKGDTVKVHYTGKLDNGDVFDSSSGRDPLEFTVGESQVIPGFEEAVVGMAPGDSASTTIPVDSAYGPRRDDMVLMLGRDMFPPGMELEVGHVLQLRTESGEQFQAMVIELGEEKVTLDANHPLAGKDLTFDIELVEIK